MYGDKKNSYKQLFKTVSSAGFVLALLVGLSACTSKKREVHFAQGDSTEGLLVSQDYFDKEFPITTLGAKTNSLNLSTMTKNTASKGSQFKIVDYTTTTPLIAQFNQDKFPLVARENTEGKYWFFFRLSNSHVTVYKKALAIDLPEHELAYAEKQDQHMIVPQFSFRISLHKVEKIRNSDNEDTNTLRVFSVQNLQDAQYFKPELNSAQYMREAPKQFVFPRSFFEGENGKKSQWYYASTIIGGSAKHQIMPGMDLSADFELNPVSRVEFTVDQYRLSAKNTNIDESLAEDEINKEDVLNIAISTLDYRLRPTAGSTPSLEEEVLDDRHPNARPWNEREYIQLDFSKVSVWVAKQIENKSNFGDSMLIDLTVEDDYFGFTVYYVTSKIKIRYSFRKAHEPVEGRIAFEQDMRRHFGYFTTAKHFVPGAQHVRTEDFSRNSFINRFYPKADDDGIKRIKYYMSTGSPDDTPYMQAIEESIAEWNRIFQATGTGIMVSLEKDKKVDLGDIRYNIINLVDENFSAGVLGYGPSVADTKSGEIISATSNIFVQPFREIYINGLRNYVYSELGLITDDKFYDPTPVLEELIKKFSSQNIDTANLQLVLDVNKANPGIVVGNQSAIFSAADATMNVGPVAAANRRSRAAQTDAQNPNQQASAGINPNSWGHKMRVSSCRNISISQKELVKQAQAGCQQLNDYVKELKSLQKPGQKAVTHIEDKEYAALLSCANIVLVGQLKETLMHELGHNFGLRHNFLASTDIHNFADNVHAGNVNDVKKARPASSVMDYLPITAPAHTTLGPYDEAAVRFGYAGKMETVDQQGRNTKQYADLDVRRPLDRQDKYSQFRKFKFCTDEDVDPRTFTKEPMCAVFDYGTTPLEIIHNYIVEMNSYMSTARYRFDLVTVPRMAPRMAEHEELGLMFERRYVFPMLKIYNEWRVRLTDVLRGDIEKHLEGMSDTTFEQRLFRDSARLDSNKRQELFNFYAASQMIADMLFNVATKPAMQCFGQNAQGHMVHRSFVSIAGDLKVSGRTPEEQHLKDCSDPRVARMIGAVGGTFGYGDYFTNHQFSADIQQRTDYWIPDIVGIEEVVERAASAMAGPTQFVVSTSQRSDQLQLNPTILQEPNWLQKFTDKLIERFTKGVAIADFHPTLKDKAGFIFSFKEYKEVIIQMRNTLSRTVKSISSPAIRAQVGMKFTTLSTSYDQNPLLSIPANALTWSYPQFGQQRYFYAPAGATIAAQLIETYHRNSIFENIAVHLLGGSVDSDESEDTEVLATSISNVSLQKVSDDWKSAMEKFRDINANKVLADLTVKEAIDLISFLASKDVTNFVERSGADTSVYTLEIAARGLMQFPAIFQEIMNPSESMDGDTDEDIIDGGGVKVRDYLARANKTLPDFFTVPVAQWDQLLLQDIGEYMQNRDELRAQVEAIRNSFNTNFGQ